MMKLQTEFFVQEILIHSGANNSYSIVVGSILKFSSKCMLLLFHFMIDSRVSSMFYWLTHSQKICSGSYLIIHKSST